MTYEQAAIFSILVGVMALFIWGRWRHDIVAVLALIGHQNNMLIMGPGGYHFGDYWRVGLPLEVIIVGVGLPMILWVWPL